MIRQSFNGLPQDHFFFCPVCFNITFTSEMFGNNPYCGFCHQSVDTVSPIRILAMDPNDPNVKQVIKLPADDSHRASREIDACLYRKYSPWIEADDRVMNDIYMHEVRKYRKIKSYTQYMFAGMDEYKLTQDPESIKIKDHIRESHISFDGNYHRCELCGCQSELNKRMFMILVKLFTVSDPIMAIRVLPNEMALRILNRLKSIDMNVPRRIKQMMYTPHGFVMEYLRHVENLSLPQDHRRLCAFSEVRDALYTSILKADYDDTLSKDLRNRYINFFNTCSTSPQVRHRCTKCGYFVVYRHPLFVGNNLEQFICCERCGEYTNLNPKYSEYHLKEMMSTMRWQKWALIRSLPNGGAGVVLKDRLKYFLIFGKDTGKCELHPDKYVDMNYMQSLTPNVTETPSPKKDDSDSNRKSDHEVFQSLQIPKVYRKNETACKQHDLKPAVESPQDVFLRNLDTLFRDPVMWTSLMTAEKMKEKLSTPSHKPYKGVIKIHNSVSKCARCGKCGHFKPLNLEEN